MGLAERRALAAVKDNQYKTFEGELKTTCGFDVKTEFDWSQVENHKDCVWICENNKVNSYMLEPILTAIKTICSDSMGKEAVAAGLKEIRMIPVSGDAEFANGVLTVRNDLTGNGAYGADSIKDVIEKGL